MQVTAGILLGRGDFLARQLPGRNRIVALDAGRHLAVGDSLDLERVQFAELGDLVEAQRGVLDQPYRRSLGHQRGFAHLDMLLAIARARGSGFGPEEAQPRKTEL